MSVEITTLLSKSKISNNIWSKHYRPPSTQLLRYVGSIGMYWSHTVESFSDTIFPILLLHYQYVQIKIQPPPPLYKKIPVQMENIFISELFFYFKAIKNNAEHARPSRLKAPESRNHYKNRT